jgi:hypothetical protein
MTDPRPLLSEIARLKAELDDTREAVTIAYMVSAEKAKDEIARLKADLAAAEEATRKAQDAIPTATSATSAAVAKERAASAKRITELESLLAKATRFDVGADIRVENRSTNHWTIFCGCSVMNADGAWSFEPQPSSRTDEFKARTRFPFDEAMRRAEEIVEKERHNA